MVNNSLNNERESGLSSFFSRFKEMILSSFKSRNNDEVAHSLLGNTQLNSRINTIAGNAPVGAQNAFTRGADLDPNAINTVQEKSFSNGEIGTRMMSIKMKAFADKGYSYPEGIGKNFDSNGIDCSGFVWQSYNKMGVKLKTKGSGEDAKGTLQQKDLDLGNGFTKKQVNRIDKNNLPPEGSMILLLKGSKGPDDRHVVLVGKDNQILESQSPKGTRSGPFNESWNSRFKDISVITPTEAMREKLFSNNRNDPKLMARAVESLKQEHGVQYENNTAPAGIVPQKPGVSFVINKDLLGSDTKVYTNNDATLKPVVFDFK